MNNLPEYIRDVFKTMMEICFDYELVHIEHSILSDNDKDDTELWYLVFYEKGVIDYLNFVVITYQPWNPTPVYKSYTTVPMRILDEVLTKVEEIRNGNL